MIELSELHLKLSSPRTPFRQETKVTDAVQEILRARGAENWIVTEIKERIEEKFRQDRRGRPNDQTRYVEERRALTLSWRITSTTRGSPRKQAGDGVFPLVTNDDSLSDLEMLLAYKSQPALEKRFSHLKTDFEVARFISRRPAGSRRYSVSISWCSWWSHSLNASCIVPWTARRLKACRCTPRVRSVAVPWLIG